MVGFSSVTQKNEVMMISAIDEHGKHINKSSKITEDMCTHTNKLTHDTKGGRNNFGNKTE